MNIRLCLFVCLFFTQSKGVFSQVFQKDSLERLLKDETRDTRRVDIMNQLAYQYYDFNDSLGFQYAEKALNLSQKIGYKVGVKQSLSMVGLGYLFQASYRKAITYLMKSDAIKVDNTEYIDAYNLSVLGNCYRDLASFDSALFYFDKSYQAARGDSVAISNALKNKALVYLILYENNRALEVLDSASNYGVSQKKDIHTQLRIWSAYGQLYKNLVDYEKSQSYYDKMCEQAMGIEDHYYSIKCLLNKAELEFQKGMYPLALNYTFQALQVTKEYHYPPINVQVLTQAGEIYSELSQYALATEYFFKALKIAEQYELKYEVAELYSEIAWVNKDLGKYDLGLQYLDKSLAIRQKIGDKKGVANCYNIFGLIHLLQNKLDISIADHEKALAIRKEIAFEEGISASLFNLSLVFEKKGDLQKAYQYQKRCLEIDLKVKNDQSTGITYNEIAGVLIKMDRLKEAEEYLDQGQLLAKRTGSLLLLRNNIQMFVSLYEKQNDLKKALEFQKRYQRINDSIYSEDSAFKLAEVEALYQVQARDARIEQLSLQKKLQQEELSRKNVLLISVFATISLMSIAGYALFRNYRIKAKANQELTKLNKEIHEQKEEILAQSEELVEANQTISSINKALELKVEERTSEVRQAYKELDTFFYRSSHDFRRPITTFLGLAEVAKITVKDENAQELFGKVKETAQNLDKMLVKLQSISNFGTQQIAIKEVFTKELVDQVLDIFREEITKRGIAVSVIEKNEGAFYSYPVLIKTIIENLLENSIQFCVPVKPVIIVTIESQPEQLTIEVEDNGQGISNEYQNRIFEMYFRANERSQGNGLGLYIIKKAVEKLNGEVRFKSQVGVGSHFEVRIPHQLS